MVFFIYTAVLTAAHVLAYIWVKNDFWGTNSRANVLLQKINSGWFLLLYIPVLNLILLQLAGRYIILSFVVYPY